MSRALLIILTILSLSFNNQVNACSVIYYLDSISGKIYVANHEDFWYDTKAYIQINPRTKNKLARLWYGWDDFAQGGINEAGLFFDGAVTPLGTVSPWDITNLLATLEMRFLQRALQLMRPLDSLNPKKLH